VRDGIAKPVLIGPGDQIRQKLVAAGGDERVIEILDPANAPQASDYATAYFELRKHKGLDEAKAKQAMLQPLNFAAMMVREGDAQGSIGGAVETTAATVRAALQIIGVAKGVSTVSSFFLLFPPEGHAATSQTLMFSDCALVIAPNQEQLVDIACSSADSYKKLLNETPRTAMLSFSTHGSGAHEVVQTVASATDSAKASRPDLLIDGEIQFDAAFVETVAARKAPDSVLEGAANVFIFPNLDAGNIGYKIAQRLGGMQAVGPILQGLNKPANDLSRGCSAEDVYGLMAVTCVQGQVEH